MFDKPVDRWLGLGGIAVAIALYLLPKTPLVVVVCVLIIFGVLVHPVWNFWWIEETLGRRIGALVLLAGVLIILGDLSWPQTEANSADQTKIKSEQQSPSPSTKTLHELFLTDCNNDRSLSDYTWTTKQGISYKIEYIICMDFNSKTQYLSFFLPKSDMYTLDALNHLPAVSKEIMSDKNIRSLMKGLVSLPPGEKSETWDELTFSGRVYVYHETIMLQSDIDRLMKEYKEQGLSPQFRSRDYLILRNSPLYEEQYKGEERPVVPERPDLKLSLRGGNVFVSGSDARLTGLAIDVSIRNAGAPSIATDWAMQVTPPGKAPVKAQLTKPPPILTATGQHTSVLKASDFSIEDMASSKPLSIGDPLLTGKLLFYVLLPKKQVLAPGTYLELSVNDYSGHTFSIRQRMGDWLSSK